MQRLSYMVRRAQSVEHMLTHRAQIDCVVAVAVAE